MRYYAGPILDAHHHLWDYELGFHSWLNRQADPDGDGLPMGDLAPLRRNFLIEDLAALVARENVVGSIHIEAGWSCGPEGAETAWLDSLERDRLSQWHVFNVDLARPDAAMRVAQEASHPRAVGVRDILAWHPEPARSFAASKDRMFDPKWRSGLSAVQAAGLVFDLMIFPHQADDAAALADDFPDLQFVINHCGSPADRSSDGMRLWRLGLAELAKRPNVAIKISNPVAYDHHWTEESLRMVIIYCYEIFGAKRSIFGSDAPVSGLQARYGDLVTVYRRVLSGEPEEDQRAFFHDNAFNIYNLVEKG